MKGKNCCMTEEGKKTFPTQANRRGSISGESRDGKIWYVLWDGRCSVDPLHKDYIQVLD